jgi:hypothetical protein
MLISYEMFVRYYEDISQMHFDLLICDEGHRLKNTTIKTYAVSTKGINKVAVGQFQLSSFFLSYSLSLSLSLSLFFFFFPPMTQFLP